MREMTEGQCFRLCATAQRSAWAAREVRCAFCRRRSFAAILCTGGADVIRKEAWPFYTTISGVRLCWGLEEPKGPKGSSLQTNERSSLPRSG